MNKQLTIPVLLCALLGSVQARAQQPAEPARQTVTKADQLPRRTYTLPRLPSELLAAPAAELAPLAKALEADTLADLSAYDIKDAATLRDLYGRLAALAQLRGDWQAVPGWTAKARALQEKAGARLSSGVLTDLIAQQRAERRDDAWLNAEVARRYGAMPWQDVQETVKAAKAGLETYNPDVLAGLFRTQFDPIAANGKMQVPAAVLATLLSVRVQMDVVAPHRAAVIAALKQLADANAGAQAPDLWTPRTFALPAGAQAAPVTVAIWDSGVDLALFRTAPGRGLAFGPDGSPSADLLRPLGDAAPRWPQLRGLVKGAMDLRASLDSEDARAFRTALAGMKPDQVRQFVDDTALASTYLHGTHVAGIAIDGNPYASVFAGTIHFNSSSVPLKPDEASSARMAAMFRTTVQRFKDAGVRVVNMSWRYGPRYYETALAYHHVGATDEERRALAARLFRNERDALRAAIAGAPEILFIAGSGNEDNSADFEEYIPASLDLPNLLTVGAVDRSGRETSFSTFGKTVAVHANGAEVDSVVPGGVRMKLSGTSMASPQAANLAAKLLALKPSLTALEVKSLILAGAERLPGADGKPGRVNLINPRRSAELAGIRL
jgi:subtilisin family serine protease